MFAETHAEHRFIVGQDHQNHVAVHYGLFERAGLDGATRDEIGGSVRRSVPDGDLVSRFKRTCGEGAAHVSHAEDSNSHQASLWLPCQ
jgi:hypothetical protein